LYNGDNQIHGMSITKYEYLVARSSPLMNLTQVMIFLCVS